MLAPIGIVLALVLALVVQQRPVVPIFYWTLLMLLLTLGGLAANDAERSVDLFCAGVAFLTLGYGIESARSGALAHRAIGELETPRIPPMSRIVMLNAATLTLCVGYYVLNGIPVLSSNIEVARYEFGSSAFVSLLGRVVTIGVPVVLLVVASIYAVAPSAHVRRRLVEAFGMLIATRVLGGFRSGLLEVLVLSALATALVYGRLRAGTLARFIPIGALAVAGAIVLTGSYATIDDGPLSALAQRLTVGIAEPVDDVFDAASDGGAFPQSVLINDVNYFLLGPISTSAAPYDFNEYVSAGILGTVPAAGFDSVPVTTGAIAELNYDFGGWYLLVLAMLGVLFRRLESLLSSKSWLRAGSAACSIVILSCYLTQGNLVYLVLAWLPIVLVAMVGLRFGTRDRGRTSRRAVVRQ